MQTRWRHAQCQSLPVLVYLGMVTSLLHRPSLYPVALLRVFPLALHHTSLPLLTPSCPHTCFPPCQPVSQPPVLLGPALEDAAHSASVRSSLVGHPQEWLTLLVSASTCCRLPGQAAPLRGQDLVLVIFVLGHLARGHTVGVWWRCQNAEWVWLCTRKETDTAYQFSNQPVSAFWECVLLFLEGPKFLVHKW